MNHQESITFIKKYVEDLLSFFEINTEVLVSVRDDFLDVSIPASDISSILIGRNAENLRSIQLVLSNVLHAQKSVFSRINLDIADYKKQRAEKIAHDAEGWFAQVLESGIQKSLHLNAADRRIVHNEAQKHTSIETRSEGEGQDRVLIIAKKT